MQTGRQSQTIVTDTMSQIETRAGRGAHAAEWAALWRSTPATRGAEGRLRTRTVVAVFLGTRMSAATRRDHRHAPTGALVVEWGERRPSPACDGAGHHQPAHIATIPKFAGEIRFEKVER